MSARMKFVACGDSVMWGQGLLHADKFVVRAARQIASMHGAEWRDDDLEMLAHSGAQLDATAAQREEFIEKFALLFSDQPAIRGWASVAARDWTPSSGAPRPTGAALLSQFRSEGGDVLRGVIHPELSSPCLLYTSPSPRD